MRVHLHTQLTQALLAELASALYPPGARFLSNRKICRHWRVSEPTAKTSLGWLVRQGLVVVRPRSGYYVRTDSQKRALLFLHRRPQGQLAPTPTWEAGRFRILAPLPSAKRKIGVVLAGHPLGHQGGDRLPPSGSVSSFAVAQGVFHEANRRGVSLVFFIDDGNARRRQLISHELIRQKVAGVVAFRRLNSYVPLRPLLDPLLKANLPVVAGFDDCEGIRAFSINVNNVGIGSEIAHRFLRLGHRRLAILLPKVRGNYFADRAAGCHMAVKGSGLKDVRLQVLRMTFGRSEEPRLKALLKDPCRRPTAILVSAMSLLPALWRVVRRLRLRVPKDLSLAAVSGVATIPEVKRPLDMFRLNFHRIGQEALSRLLDCLDGRPVEHARLISPPYLARGTVAEAPGSRD